MNRKGTDVSEKDITRSRCGKAVDVTISLQAHNPEKASRPVCMECFKKMTNQIIEKVRRA